VSSRVLPIAWLTDQLERARAPPRDLVKSLLERADLGGAANDLLRTLGHRRSRAEHNRATLPG
jgi:hypothetical protein